MRQLFPFFFSLSFCSEHWTMKVRNDFVSVQYSEKKQKRKKKGKIISYKFGVNNDPLQEMETFTVYFYFK